MVSSNSRHCTHPDTCMNSTYTSKVRHMGEVERTETDDDDQSRNFKELVDVYKR